MSTDDDLRTVTLPHAAPRPRSLTLRRTVTGVVIGVTLGAVTIGVAGGIAGHDFTQATADQVDRLDPSNAQSRELAGSVIDQETGVRGYLLTGDASFLEPYRQGQVDERAAIAGLREVLPTDRLRSQLQVAVDAAQAWRDEFAEPAIAGVVTRGAGPVASGGAGAGTGVTSGDVRVDDGKARFDAFRSASDRLTTEVSIERRAARDQLHNAQTRFTVVLSTAFAAAIAVGVVLWVTMYRWIIFPVERLGAEVRSVVRGRLDHRVSATGPKEIVNLGTDIDGMRQRIVDDLEEVRRNEQTITAQAADLRRSNADLEQFAYVASHDLQEPLRKVASFCQLLERRYRDQLDERGTQYIDFAVDGAKRMQSLINDLLTFSRVGRTTERFGPVELAEAAQRASANLASRIEDERAVLEMTALDGLPTVHGDPTLLTALFQNLLGNAVKFRGDDPPVVHIDARVDDHEDGRRTVHVAVSDNGIGIEPQYADRIFVIFQRLHSKEAYDGTGIGLALCKKIVEFHGGEIWLDTDDEGGSTFRFTIPVVAPSTSPPTTAGEPS